jgi:hypothetical protein
VYEWGRIGKLVLAAGVVFILHHLFISGSFELLWEFLLLIVFGVAVVGLRVVKPAELRALRALFAAQKSGDAGVESRPELKV